MLKLQCLLASLFNCLNGIICFHNFKNSNQVPISEICMLFAIVNLMLDREGADRYPLRPVA